MSSTHPSNKITNDNVDEVVTYHIPTPEQIQKHGDLARATKEMIEVILRTVPDCADRSAAIRCVREAKMWASAAVALEPTIEPL